MSVESAFASFPALTTTRLHLREILPPDAEALFAIKSNPEITAHYGQEPHQSLADTLTWIQKLQDGYRQHLDIAWCVALKDKDALIGAITLWNLDPTYHCGEIGYELHPAYEKQGIMREAIAAVLTFAFTDLGLHRVEATPFADNPASQNLLLKLGFSYEGMLRERYFFRDHYKDQLYFGLLAEEWLKQDDS